MTQRIFLIGATGRIGRHLLDELAPDHQAQRLHVTVGVRSARSKEAVGKRGFEPVDFDLDDPSVFETALRAAETIFLLRPYTLKHMMHGKTVTDAARRAGVRHIVSLGAYGRPETPWPVIAWNMLVEAYIERSGLAWTHLQPNYFMDNVLVQRDPATRTLYNRITVPVSWIACEDIAAVAAAVLRDPSAHAGRTYALASEAADVFQIAAWMTEVSGEPHTVGVTPRAKMMERLLAQGREPEYALALVDYVDAVSRGEVPESADTFDTVEEVAGRPAIRFREFLARNLRPASDGKS